MKGHLKLSFCKDEFGHYNFDAFPLFSAVTGTQYEEMVTAITSMGYERDQVLQYYSYSTNFDMNTTTYV